MANHKQTTTLVIPVSKPRNPFMVAALTRRAGSHDKSPKAVRQQTRQRFQRALDSLLRGDRTDNRHQVIVNRSSLAKHLQPP